MNDVPVHCAAPSSYINSSGEKKRETTCEIVNKKQIRFNWNYSITEEGSSQPKTFPWTFIEKVSNRSFRRYGGHFDFYCFERHYGMLRGQINMYLPPRHPIIAIRNNRNQNGRRIGKKGLFYQSSRQFFIILMLSGSFVSS